MNSPVRQIFDQYISLQGLAGSQEILRTAERNHTQPEKECIILFKSLT